MKTQTYVRFRGRATDERIRRAIGAGCAERSAVRIYFCCLGLCEVAASPRPNSRTRCRSSGERVSITSRSACASGKAFTSSGVDAFFNSGSPIRYSMDTPKKSASLCRVSNVGSLVPCSYLPYVDRSIPSQSATSCCVSLRLSLFRTNRRLFTLSPNAILSEETSHFNKREDNPPKCLTREESSRIIKARWEDTSRNGTRR